MRRRGVLVIALAVIAAVGIGIVVLRDGVRPVPRAVDRDTTAPSPGARPADVLPLREVDVSPDWPRFTMVGGFGSVQADRDRVAYLGISGYPELIVIDRAVDRGGERSRAVHPLPETIAMLTGGWLLHGGAVYFVERDPVGTDDRLVRLDPATGASSTITLRSGLTPVGGELVGVGVELLMVGRDPQGRNDCVVAVSPAAGTDRIVVCAELDNQEARLAGYGDEALVGYSSGAPGCSDWLRSRPDGGLAPVRLDPGACDPHSLAVLGDWRVAAPTSLGHPTERGLVVGHGPDGQLTLDVAGASAVGCGRHVYWTALTGAVHTLRRWEPGADHVEQVYRAGPGRSVAAPVCRAGVLTVSTFDLTADVGAVEALVVDRP